MISCFKTDQSTNSCIEIHLFGTLIEQFRIICAYTSNKLSLENVHVKLNTICSSYDFSKNFPDFDKNYVSSLIRINNTDYYTSQITKKEQKTHQVELPLRMFGLMVGHQPTYSAIQQSQISEYNEDAEIFELLVTTWIMKTYRSSPEEILSKDKSFAFDIFRQTFTNTKGWYELGLLWKPNACLASQNFAATQACNVPLRNQK